MTQPAAVDTDLANTVREPGPRGHPDGDALASRVTDTLTEYLAERRRDTATISESFAEAVDRLVDFVLRGGKRMRPTFAWWGWRGAGGRPSDPTAPAVLKAISALELIQACALIHDDLMDSSTTRRGWPTVHVEFAARHQDEGWIGRPARFGTAAAVLLGDLALAWADDMLHSAGMPAAKAQRAAPVWRAMRTEVLGGQYLDVLHQATGDCSAAAALQVSRYKTAAYTVERPLLLGAALADATSQQLAAYQRFGADVGVAFQLRDDLLGVFGDPGVTGKPAGDDIREGKRTLLVALALERAELRGAVGAARTITDALADETLDAARLDTFRSVLTELGAVDAVEQRISQLTDGAHDALAAVELAEPAAARLHELAIAATRRAR